MPEKVKMFKCVCGFLTPEEGTIGSHVRIMNGVYGIEHYEVK